LLQDVKEETMDFIMNAGDTSYLTHGFHPYPAKFVPQIPNFFIKRFTEIGDTVLDPFCGSGTTLVEAKLLDRSSIGIDLHPLGVLMSRVKTTKLPSKELSQISALVSEIEKHVSLYVQRELEDETFLSSIEEDSQIKSDYTIPDFKNRDHWFQKNVLHELSIIKSQIDKSPLSPETKEFLHIGFSSVIVPVSNQESETRYAAIEKNIPPFQAFTLFKKRVQNMVDAMYKFNKLASDRQAQVFEADTRYVDFIESNSVDFIMTSPPYPNTYDYYLYHKYRMNFLDLKWEHMKAEEIGSRLRHSSRKEPIAEFVTDMKDCFMQLSRITKHGSNAVFVMGDSIIRKKLIPGDDLIKEISEPAGFVFLDSIQYDLSFASKTFNKAFRNKNKKEHIILLRKECGE